MLVSIITPCYNSSSYLRYTIESVISQTIQNWEMLIIDDCSTDDSASIIREYCLKDSRIKYLETETSSGSPSVPRNIGIQSAKGDYIAFLDSDDIWLPHKLEEQISFLEKNNYKFIYSNYEKIDINGMQSNRKIIVSSVSNYENTLYSCNIPCLTVVIAKEIIGDTYFRCIKKEDYVFWLEILKKGVTAYNTGKVHALYRESSLSRSSNKIAMIKQQWHIIREIERKSFLKSSICMFVYACEGLKKFLI